MDLSQLQIDNKKRMFSNTQKAIIDSFKRDVVVEVDYVEGEEISLKGDAYNLAISAILTC